MEYKPKGVCSRLIHFDIVDNKVRNVSFVGGCRRLSPRVTGMKLFSRASVISFPEKSPSGPMRIVMSWPG